ncbi:unnamed protein product [Closterium sp. NIES-65]|nr:unnamed protein product [Closterium sp. NIES-65]
MLQLPSGKLFIKIFEFVMKQMDPKFKYGNKPEDDILEVMKGLHYPYNLSRSSLQQAGTPHTWPPLLAMLNWLVQTLNFIDATSDPGAMPAQLASSTARGFESSLTNPTLETLLDEEHCRAVFFEFMKEGYHVFMNAETEELSDTRIEHIMQQFMAYFEGARQEVESDVQKLQEVLLRKEATLKRKQDRSELEKLLEDKATLEKLQGELVKATEQGKIDLQTIEETLLVKQQELKDHTETTISIQANNALLQKRIEEQRFSREDIERMAERLAGRNTVLQTMKENRMQVEKEACKAEVQKVKTVEEIEQAANMFNEMATRLKLIPPSSKHAQGRCFSVRVNPHATNIRDVLSDSMPKADIRAAIQEVTQKYSSKEQRLYAELATLDIQLAEESEEVGKISAELESKEDVKKREEEEMLQVSQCAQQEVRARLEDSKRREFLARVEIENRAASLETLRQKNEDCDIQLKQQSQAELQAMEEMKGTAVRLEDMLGNHLTLVSQIADSVASHGQQCLSALQQLPE